MLHLSCRASVSGGSRTALQGLLRRSLSAAAPVVDGLIGAVGNTPLIRLKTLSEQTGCDILVKNEAANPGGSIKDRAALYLIKDAVRKGELQEGGTVVEGTAGNTGIGLAHMCNALGYKCVIYMPDNQSDEKISALKMLGADVRPVPVAPFTDEMNYNHQARRYAESLDNAVWTNQFDNVANKGAHIVTTGPEIWHQTGGKVDAFTCATGTGGTLAGVAEFLKSKNEHVKIVVADPPGSVLYKYFTQGVLEREGDGSITEGIGQGRVTDNMKGAKVDTAIHVPDEDSVRMVYHLLHEEGFCVGASSGLNVSAAVRVAEQMGPGHTIVSMICDNGLRYATRLFNREWLAEKGLLSVIPEHQWPQ